MHRRTRPRRHCSWRDLVLLAVPSLQRTLLESTARLLTSGIQDDGCYWSRCAIDLRFDIIAFFIKKLFFICICEFLQNVFWSWVNFKNELFKFLALCRRVALRHTGVIVGTCLASSYLEVTNMWFALESLPLNLYFMYLGKLIYLSIYTNKN